MVSSPEGFFLKLSEFMGVEFSMEKIKKELKIRVNESPLEIDLEEIRINNILAMAKRCFPDAAIEMTMGDQNGGAECALMDNELRTKLENHLRGKCSDYF